MMTTMDEDNNNQTKVPGMSLFNVLVVSRWFVLLPNSMSKLIHNRCICKLIIKTTAASVFYFFIGYFVVLDIPDLWKL